MIKIKLLLFLKTRLFNVHQLVNQHFFSPGFPLALGLVWAGTLSKFPCNITDLPLIRGLTILLCFARVHLKLQPFL